MQDPERLREACREGGVDEDVFGTVFVGETVRLWMMSSTSTSGV